MYRYVITLALLATPIIAAADGIKAEIVEYGIYYTSFSGNAAAPNTTSGEITLLSEPVHVRSTTEIPAMTKSSFGLRYKLEGMPKDAKIRVTDVIVTPGLKDPNTDGPIFYRESHDDVVQGDQTVFTGYTFDQSWEAVTGDWAIEVWHGDIQLLSKKFKVVPAKRLRN